MTAEADPTDLAPPKKSSKLPLIIGVVLALLGAGGGFMVVKLGLIGGGSAEPEPVEEVIAPLEPAAFVAFDPLIVNVSDPSGRRFVRFAPQLEVPPEHLAEVEGIKPRIVDVMNSYLRAVEPRDFEDQTALVRLRAQLLRRIQVVAGEGRVRDLLVMEFVLN